ncbi:anaphase promoting complex subunit 5 [Linnemannia schmuckeri]|uniref:Anaphase-promoting complex subunit 5 n=1 Tax=Linnemannia schmuckeri TaxID=64567 RepID=A0A9P5SA41_9FUNG|nr:anaphase promoting complex subunit 5 [Linnemannia schmuckeri]
MTSKRAFARTATDISLRPPQTQTFAELDGIAEDYDDDFHDPRVGGPGGASRGRLAPDPVHAVPYLTPHKVSVLILVEFFCRNQCPPDTAQQLLLFLLDCIQDSSEYLHRDVNEFGGRISSEVGQIVWKHLKDTLKRIKSPHHLNEFFMCKLEHDPMDDPMEESGREIGLADLIHDPNPNVIVVENDTRILLEPSSVLGLYVRKARIEFRKLSFEEVCKCYTALEIYSSALDHPTVPSPTDRRQYSQSPGGSALMSLFDVEKYLDTQTDKLSDPSQSSIPDDLLAHVYEIQSRMPALAKTHYITCLHAQQMGDFEIAIQSLYRFFDYCISMQDQVLYQYALLNLAMLHARFSNYDQALIALEETIEMARSQLDQECLSYASNWLNRMTRTIPGTGSDMNKAQTLAELAGEMDEQSSQYLTSLNELNNAKQLQGESTPRALESLVKASSINMRHSLEGVGGVVNLFQSRIWGAYGNHPLSSLYSQLQLKYRPSEVDLSDATSGFTKHASDLTLNGHFEDALRVIEQAKSKFPLNSLKAAPWVQTLVQLLQRKAMSSNNLRDAEIWNQQLGSTLLNTPRLNSSNRSANNSMDSLGGASPEGGGGGSGGTGSGAGATQDAQLDDTSLELQLDILLQNALLSVLVDQRQSGVHQLSEGLAVLQQNQWYGTNKFTIIYLLALAEIFMDSENAISAVPLLLTAATLSEDSFQRPLLLLVKLRLAEVLLYLDNVQHAKDLVDSIMSMALNQGDMFVQALAYFQSAKCLLACVHRKKSSSSSDRHRGLQDVVVLLKHALNGYRQIDSVKDVVQVLYFQTRVYRELGQDEYVETSLGEFKAASVKLTAAQNERAPSWFSYYYTRDAFDGLLRANEPNNAADSLPRAPSSSNLLAGGNDGGLNRIASGILSTSGGGGFKRSGTTQWNGGLKRTSSQLWKSTVRAEKEPTLPQHEEEAMDEDGLAHEVDGPTTEIAQASVEGNSDSTGDDKGGEGVNGVDGVDMVRERARDKVMSPELVDINATSGPSQQKRRRFGSE